MFQNRNSYRSLCKRDDLVSYQVTVRETDVFIRTATLLDVLARNLVLEYRGYLESYIEAFPEFQEILEPWPYDALAPPLVKSMIDAAKKAGVGPMAAVAGAVSEAVGMELAKYSDEVIVENGGDIFVKTGRPLTVGIFAGESPLTGKIGLKFNPCSAFGICTSSGTVGHSLSFGQADAVCIVSPSCALADAAATAVGNIVNKASDIHPAIDFARQTIKEVTGILVVKGKHMGVWGDFELVPFS